MVPVFKELVSCKIDCVPCISLATLLTNILLLTPQRTKRTDGYYLLGQSIQKHRSHQAKLISYFLSSIISLLNNTLSPSCIHNTYIPIEILDKIHNGKYFTMKMFHSISWFVVSIISVLSSKMRSASTFVSLTYMMMYESMFED